VGEEFGDRVLTINVEHNFRDELFRISGIPVLRDLELQVRTFINAAWTGLSVSSAKILPVAYRGSMKPLYEAGFSLGHVLFPLSIEFTWRLTDRETKGFAVGVNAFLL